MANSEQLSFKKTVASLTKEVQSLACPFNGIITQCLISCPPGPRYVVEIQIKKQQDPIFPTNGGYFTIDNATVSFPLNETIKGGDVITIEWINHGSYEHTIPIIISIVSGEKLVTL